METSQKYTDTVKRGEKERNGYVFIDQKKDRKYAVENNSIDFISFKI